MGRANNSKFISDDSRIARDKDSDVRVGNNTGFSWPFYSLSPTLSNIQAYLDRANARIWSDVKARSQK